MDALRQIEEWDVPHAAAAVVTSEGTAATHGDATRVYRWASVTKPVTALAVLVAAEEGTLELDAESRGSPAAGLHGSLDDLARFAHELQRPTVVAGETLAEATTVAFPGLDGVLPDFGRQTPNDWGLGFEIRDGKSPHWTGSSNSPRTYGHFGGAGTFIWV